MSTKCEFGSWPLEEVNDAIEQAIQDLAREGLIVDTGQRRWSERTRSYQIVWAAREFADRDQQKKLNWGASHTHSLANQNDLTANQGDSLIRYLRWKNDACSEKPSP
jgi:hypothetical protein